MLKKLNFDFYPNNSRKPEWVNVYEDVGTYFIHINSEFKGSFEEDDSESGFTTKDRYLKDNIKYLIHHLRKIQKRKNFINIITCTWGILTEQIESVDETNIDFY